MNRFIFTNNYCCPKMGEIRVGQTWVGINQYMWNGLSITIKDIDGETVTCEVMDYNTHKLNRQIFPMAVIRFGFELHE